MKTFRILSLLCCIALVLACAKEDSQETTYDYEAVFLGDSITANWRNPEKGGHPEFFTSNNFLAMGYSGKTTAGLKKLFKASVINENPRQVVILAGINDVAQNDGEYVPNEKIVENLAWMAKKCNYVSGSAFVPLPAGEYIDFPSQAVTGSVPSASRSTVRWLILLRYIFFAVE